MIPTNELMRASLAAVTTGFATAAAAAQIVIDPETTFLPLSIIVTLFVVAIAVTVKVVRILDRIASMAVHLGELKVELQRIVNIEDRVTALEKENES